MKKVIFKGCATAIVTPFDDENKVNFDEFRRLINFQIDNKVNAIVVCGTTGEGATLSKEETKALIEYCVKVVNKRVPVIAGIGGNNTKVVIENAKSAEKVGADGLLAVTPYYNKTTQEGLVEHFKVISENTNLPIILYNVPSRTGLDIHPFTYLKLSKIKNIVATKEASGDISKVLKIRNLCKDDLNIYSGNDDQIIPILSLGGIGVISVLSNIMPKYTSEMIIKYFDKQIEEAFKMQIEVSNLIEYLFEEVNPIPVKEALNLMKFKCGIPRLPLIKCSNKIKSELEIEMKKLNLII